MRSVASVQKKVFNKTGKRISLEQARNILLESPFLEPIEGSWDKFRMIDEDKQREVIERIGEEGRAKEESE